MSATGACASPQAEAEAEAEADDPEFRSMTFVVNTLDDLARPLGDTQCVCKTAMPGVCSLRAAVQTANMCGDDNDEIILAVSGTYTLTLGGATDDDDASGDLDIFAGVQIRAGLPPILPPVSAVIDAQNLDRVFDIHPETAHVSFQGFKIIRGHLDPSAHPVGDANGGCIRVRSSTLNMNSIIVGGDDLDGCVGHHGGGLYAQDATVTINRSMLYGNHATSWSNGQGGVIDGYGGSICTLDTELTVNGTEMLQSVASAGGGGVAIFSDWALASFTDVSIALNGAHKGGAGGYMAAPFTMVDSDVSHNLMIDASAFGGGLLVGASPSGTVSVVEGTEIQENRAAHGGGIALFGLLDVVDSDVSYNLALGDTDPAEGGGIWQSSEGVLELDRASVHSNESAYGAGLFIGNLVNATNSTIAGNVAGADGGGLFGAKESKSHLLHCTVRDNTASSGAGGGMWIDATASASLDRSAMFENPHAAGPDECSGPVTTPTVIVGDPGSCVAPAASVIPGTLGAWGPLAYAGNTTAAFELLPLNSALSAAAPCGVAQDQWGQLRDENCDIGAYENPAH